MSELLPYSPIIRRRRLAMLPAEHQRKNSAALSWLALGLGIRAPFYEILPPTKTADRQWRWHLKGANGEIMLQGEGHPTEAGCRAAIDRNREASATTDVRVDQ